MIIIHALCVIALGRWMMWVRGERYRLATDVLIVGAVELVIGMIYL